MHYLSQRGLQAFQATYMTGSISAAAQSMNLSQPAVSRLLKDLENDLGFSLFFRVRGRLQRTPEGTAFFEEVRRSFIGLERLRVAARNIRNGHRFRLVVNALPALAATCLPRIAAAFMAEHPDTTITLQPMPSHHIVQGVIDREHSLGIVLTQSFPSGIRVLQNFRWPAMCILPAGHELVDRDVIYPADFEGQTLIRIVPGTQIGDQTTRMLDNHDVSCRTMIECNLTHFAQKLVKEGVGLAIVDLLTAAEHAREGGKICHLGTPIHFSMSFICHADSELSAMETSFLNAISHYLEALPEQLRRHTPQSGRPTEA